MREQIERALLALVGIADDAPLILHGYFLEVVKTLAEQAIVIECEVEHSQKIGHISVKPYTSITPVPIDGLFQLTSWLYNGHHGTPGKAIAIIIPLEEMMGEKQLRCSGCKWWRNLYGLGLCWRLNCLRKRAKAGQFACKKFVYRDK